MRTLFLLTTLLFIIPNMFGQKEYRLNSPDGKLEVTLYIGDRITYELTEEGHTLVAPSPLSVHLDNGTVWGNGSHLKRVSHRQANEVIPSPSIANDLLFQKGKEPVWFHGKRIDNPNTHGTGCTLSSAIASNLEGKRFRDLCEVRKELYFRRTCRHA